MHNQSTEDFQGRKTILYDAVVVGTWHYIYMSKSSEWTPPKVNANVDNKTKNPTLYVLNKSPTYVLSFNSHKQASFFTWGNWGWNVIAKDDTWT